MNDNISILKFLNLPETEVSVRSVQQTQDNLFIVTLDKLDRIIFCPECGTRMHSKGIYPRKLNHPVLNGPYAGTVTLILRQRKWHCPSCGCYTTDSFSFVGKGKQSTDIVPLMILEEMKDSNVTCRQIADRLHVSDTYVHYTFKRFVDLKRLPLSPIISVDEVHIDCDNNRHYAMVIMDFISNQIIDILPGRGKDITDAFFRSIPQDEKASVKFIVSDMYKPYIAYAGSVFPNATPVVDSFHVIQWLLNRINLYINEVKKKYQAKDREKLSEQNSKANREHKSIKESREVTLLKKHRWILLKNQDSIVYHETYHRVKGLGGSYLNTYQLEKMFLDLDPNFHEIRTLKELYISFNRDYINDPTRAGQELDSLIELYCSSSISIFRDFSQLLSTYRNEIIASFTYISKDSVKAGAHLRDTVKRISNGPMEGFNNVPKDLKRISNGVRDFEFTRNRILWATRNNPSMLGVPKEDKEIIRPTGKKRAPYNKTTD